MWRRYCVLRSPDGEFVNDYGAPPSLPPPPECLPGLRGEGESLEPPTRDKQRARTHARGASTLVTAACETVWKSSQGSGKHFCICTSVS